MNGTQGTNKTTMSHMGEMVAAYQVIQSGMPPRRARLTILLLAVCMALQMTSYGIIFPIFARRLGDFGDGVEALAMMTMAYSLSGMIASPFLGSLADRYGRRPLVLGSLAVYTAAFTGYLLATSTEMFIAIKVVVGALTAGLGPATMGIVADVSPEDELARWIGVLGGGSSAGLILGPILGGLLYDQWGYVAPFAASAGIAFIAFVAAYLLIPETHTRQERLRDALRQRRAAEKSPVSSPTVSLRASLPRPMLPFVVLLTTSLGMIFAWFFVDPQLPFYVFDQLGWTTAQFGLAISSYGWASLVGQMTLGQLSDRFGRKAILLLGLLLHSTQYVGLTLLSSYWMIFLAFIIAGLGEALLTPALNAAYLDITPEQHRARVMGIKGAVSSLGSLSAPALVIVVIRFVPPQSIFLVSAAIILGTALLALSVLRISDHQIEEPVDLRWEISRQRTMAAQASIRSIVLSASTARKLKGIV